MDKSNKSYWELISSKFYRELDEQEQTAFDEWSKDERNQSTWKKAEKVHEGLKTLKNVGHDSSWMLVQRKIRHAIFRRYASTALKYAAIFFFAFLVGKYVPVFQDMGSKVQYAEIEVLNGQMGHLFLFDGTEVWLNSGSRFKYPNRFNQKERQVFLEGEAFFKVTTNKKLPFIVQTDQMQVEVLGTSFNVLAYRDEGEQSVVLEEGKVRINRADGEKLTELLPGQRAVRDNRSLAFRVEQVKPGLYTGWKDGKVVFEDERLDEIAKKLERWYHVDINFESDDLKAHRVTGTILRNKPIDQTIMAIGLLAPIQYEHIPNTNKKDLINIKKK